MTSRAVGYTRLSRDGDSIPEQKERIRDYCERQGLQCVHIYDDGEYSSGYQTEGREEYQALRDRVENRGDIDAVVMRDTDRMGRDFDERMLFIITLRQQDVALHTVERGPRDLSDPYEVAIEGVQAASADEAKRAEIERSKAAIERRQEQGHYQGRPPFGFQFGDAGEQLEPDPDEFELAREVLLLKDRGNSYPEIEDATGVPRSTAWRIVQRRDQYEAVADGGAP